MAKIDELFRAMMKIDASDLHMEQDNVPKVRAHGGIIPLEGFPVLDKKAMQDILGEIADTEQWEHYEDCGDLDFAYQMGNEARFRANYHKLFSGYGAIFRVIPDTVLSLQQISAPEVLKTFGDITSGLILVTGPTGSGKSTTLAAVVDYINETHTRKIMTIEDPVEFVHVNKKSILVHREVGHDTKSFQSGLVGGIKSNVDIILVGEMRDEETIALALQAAEMGILVFGTLHTNSAAKTIDRIIDVFPAKRKGQMRSQLANSLQAVVSQQLLKSADGKRRWAAHEILVSIPALPAIIRSGETTKITNVIQTNQKLGMITMDDCLLKLVKEEKVSLSEARLKALDKSLFQPKE